VEIDVAEHWSTWLGTFKMEALRDANFAVYTTIPSSTPEIVDGENMSPTETLGGDPAACRSQVRIPPTLSPAGSHTVVMQRGSQIEVQQEPPRTRMADIKSTHPHKIYRRRPNALTR